MFWFADGSIPIAGTNAQLLPAAASSFGYAPANATFAVESLSIMPVFAYSAYGVREKILRIIGTNTSSGSVL
eukprot:COSAG06_NODE_5979_length_3171_cov_20.776693_5_plen_72_part_00